MTNKLKPCPWCSPHLKDIAVNVVSMSIIPDYAVQCAFCGCQGPAKDTPRKAIAAWNKRQGENDGES